MLRPTPPDMSTWEIEFHPDQDGLGTWARERFIDPGGPLTNPHHEHLQSASIGWLWTNTTAEHRGRRIAGEAQMLKEAPAKWAQLRTEMQLRQWFGHLPTFLITLDANYAREAPDDAFCALVEHELYHCGQEVDEFGSPKFKQSGEPSFTMRGHDVEQFVGVVERYGAAAAGVAEMVNAANSHHGRVQDDAVSAACGTCARRKAA